ncbi:hypothetical protein BJY04DRAFT_220307 [Aspergillus karnatakaensis]|uniref:uncharacterized protein n=1 Tax=Aspergillus karnatakaensis TaxID=1810916 RepID=UPI003CCDA2E7
MAPGITLTWLLLLVSYTQAAFIRRLPCSLDEEARVDPLFEAESLNGSIDSHDGNTTLSLQLLGDFIDDRCDELLGASAEFIVDARVLGKSVIHEAPIGLKAVCPTLSRKDNPRWDRRTYTIYEASFPLEHPYRFSTLDTTIRLHLNNTDVACVHANITPYIGAGSSQAGLLIPLAVMLLSGLVTGASRTYQKRRRSTFRYELEDDLRDPAESSMPGLGHCLHYLQFIFLTGCLTVSYPGFFRAVVSSLSWSSLIFKNWPVTHQFVYPGVQDGIYTANATFGLEEMAQYLGSTTTSDLWTNSIVNLVLLVVGVVVSIQLVFLCKWMWQLYPFRRDGHAQQTISLQREFSTLLKRTGWSVARVVLDYFIHPLIALSLFQMNNARWFPVTHTSTSLIVVAALAGVLILVVRRLVKTDRQAIFFRQTFLPWGFGQHWGFYTLYGIPFVRGLAIGGLQLSGLAELIILLGCELCILTCGVWNWYTGFTWRHALLCAARLVALSMSLVFVKEAAATERTKGIVAYGILALHLMVLIAGLAVDCLYEPLRYLLYRFGVLDSAPKRLDRAKAPVFGISQLSHRSTRRFSFAHLPPLDPAAIYSSPPHTRHSSVRRPGSSEESHSPDDLESFFRPPRTNGSIYSRDIAFSPTHSPQGSDASDTQYETVELASLDNVYETLNSTEYYAERESDQFYRRPDREHTQPARQEQEEDSRANRRRWRWKRQKPKERGFEVIRPAPVKVHPVADS